jgi:hypothetical protein
MKKLPTTITTFWICEVLGGQVLTGHTDHCPYFVRRSRQKSPPLSWGPFESPAQAAAVAAKQSSMTFRWCKLCQQTRDLPTFSDLNFQLDQARVEYNAALTSKSKVALDAASDQLDKVLRSFRLYIRKSRCGSSAQSA